MLYRHSQSQKSLLDYLLQIMPDFGKDGPATVFLFRRPTVNDKAATALFKVWKDKENTLGDYKFKRPETVAKDELDLMEREGLIKAKRDVIEVTPKGAEVIKTMILGDEKSSFDDDGIVTSFHQASENIKPKPKVAKQKGGKYANVHSGSSGTGSNWWRRVKSITKQ